MFDQAIGELGDKRISQPESFTGYCRRVGLDKPRDVPGKISIQSFSGLHASLVGSETMVFRLGNRPGCNETHFWIVSSD